jgi:hypothetical protein
LVVNETIQSGMSIGVARRRRAFIFQNPTERNSLFEAMHQLDQDSKRDLGRYQNWLAT